MWYVNPAAWASSALYRNPTKPSTNDEPVLTFIVTRQAARAGGRARCVSARSINAMRWHRGRPLHWHVIRRRRRRRRPTTAVFPDGRVAHRKRLRQSGHVTQPMDSECPVSCRPPRNIAYDLCADAPRRRRRQHEKFVRAPDGTAPRAPDGPWLNYSRHESLAIAPLSVWRAFSDAAASVASATGALAHRDDSVTFGRLQTSAKENYSTAEGFVAFHSPADLWGSCCKLYSVMVTNDDSSIDRWRDPADSAGMSLE